MKRRPHEKFCKKDPDGRCLECRKRLTTQFNAFGDMFQEVQRKIEDILEEFGYVCNSCLPAEMDYALSLMYRNTFSKMTPDVAQSVIRSVMSALGKQLNIKVFPLTERAIDGDLESRHGKRK